MKIQAFRFRTVSIAATAARAAAAAALFPAAASAAVEPVIDGGTYTFTVASGSETYSTAISGAVKIVKEGAGTLVLGASENTFTGGIEVNGGTLQGTLKALGGKLDVAAATEAPQPLVSVADGATLSIASTTCNGNYTARLAKELRVAGSGADGKGAVQRPSGSGSMHSLFDKITLTGDATLSAVQRWGFAPGSTLDMGGHDLKIVGGANFEIYNGTVTVANAGKVELLSGNFLMQGEFAGDVGSVQIDGGTFQLWGRTVPLSWPVSVAGNATMTAGSGNSRASNIVTGDVDLGATLTANVAAANRWTTLSGKVDGPGTLLKNGAGTLLLNGGKTHVVGGLAVQTGTLLLENAGSFTVTNQTAGAAGFIPNTPGGYVAGQTFTVSGAARIAVADSLLSTPPSTLDSTAATAKKHHLFVGSSGSTALPRCGILEIRPGGVVSNDLNVGRAKGGVGAVYLNGGKLHWPGGANNQGWIGHAGAGYVAVNGGEFTTRGLLTLGKTGSAGGTGGVGIVHMRGGAFRATEGHSDWGNFFSLRISRENNSYGHWYQTGGTASLAGHVMLCFADADLQQSAVEGVLTLSGQDTEMSFSGNNFVQAGTSKNPVTAVVNVNGGATLAVKRLFKNYGSTLDADTTTGKFKDAEVRESVAASKFYVNFDGGVLKVPSYSTVFNYRGDVYDDPDRVTVYAGGAVVDTSLASGGTTVWSAPVLRPSGNVLLSVSLPTDSAWANSYVAPPRVLISGASSHGATAVTEFDETAGRLTGITVTSPGNDVPSDISVTITGGDFTGAWDCPFAVGAPTKDGGFTKRGANELEMNMPAATPNTWEGPTTVEGGTLKFTNATYPAASPLVLKGGELALGGHAASMPSVEGYGRVSGSGGITVRDEIRISCADLFGEGRSVSAQKVALSPGVRLVVTDPENLANYRTAERAAFLTASASLDGDAPAVALDPACGEWTCTKSGNSLLFGFPQPLVLVLR